MATDASRYNSGTWLERTTKEERLDYLERMVMNGAEFSDKLYKELKKLTIGAIKELHNKVADRIAADVGGGDK